MPDGLTHFKNWKLGFILSSPLSIVLISMVNPAVGFGQIVGYGMGALIDPDLDQISTTGAEGRIVNNIPILGHLFYGYTSIYGSIFRKKHRSFWTHFPGVSTIIRIIFFYWWVLLLYYNEIITYNESHFYFFAGFFIGLSLADFIHWAADVLSKEDLKKSRKNKKYKRKR